MKAWVTRENWDPQMWDPFRESTSARDSEIKVEDEDIIAVGPVIVQNLKNQKEWPEEADPDMLSIPERDLYTTMNLHTPAELVELGSTFRQKTKASTCMATPLVQHRSRWGYIEWYIIRSKMTHTALCQQLHTNATDESVVSLLT